MFYHGKKSILVYLAFLVLTMMGHVQAAYVPPIGIPAPSFGIDEIAPNWPIEWPVSQAVSHYYVDNSHPQATDSNNLNGYPDKPRMTFPVGPFMAGTYIEINGGPYKKLIFPKFNCTQSLPCWLRGGDTNNKTVFQGAVGAPAGIGIQNSTYLIIENFDMNGGIGGFGAGGDNTHHITFRNSSVQNKIYPGRNTAALSMVPKNGGTVHDIVISNMYFAELGNWQTTIDQDYHAVLPSLWGRDSTASVYNIWFLDSTCFHISGNCIQINGGNWANSYKYINHIYVGRLKSGDGRQGAIGIKQSSDVILSENEIYGGRQYGSQPGDGIGYQYRPNNLWIIYNHIYDSNFGIRQSDSAWSSPNNTSYIVGNVIHDIHPLPGAPYNPNDQWRTGTAISFWKGQMNRYVVDNTIYDVHNGITSIESGPIDMSGNLISDIDPSGTFLDVSFAARNNIASFDYALFYDPDGDFSVGWNFTRYNTMSAFLNASGQCANCIAGDPAFVNPTIGEQIQNPHDFRPGKNSTAIGANNDLTNMGNNTPDVYAIFENLYGLDIRRDRAGVARPMTGRSIGAYEASDSNGGNPPIPPPVISPLVAPVLNSPVVN